ncbi:MAG: hypothetical protein U0V73_08535 [Acidimicrobiia bacterium]
MTVPSLQGRIFRAVGDTTRGEVTTATVFQYNEDDDCVWAVYAGGPVVRGFLVGRRTGDRLEARFVQLVSSGETASGYCVTRVEELGDGRLALEETWKWESRDGVGHGRLEEILVPPMP